MAHLLSSVLKVKGYAVATAAPDEKMFDCIQVMCDQNIGSIIILEGDKIVGLFTEREIVRRVYKNLNKINLATATVGEYMNPEVVLVKPDTAVEVAMQTFTNKRTRHLPVVDEENKLVGIISIGDVTKWIIDSQQVEINHLTGYIQDERTSLKKEPE